TAALLGDLAKLAAYHRRVHYLRQVREQYAADLPPGADGEPDWDGTLEALRSLDRLEQLTKVPAALQSALCTADGVDRPALAGAARELAEQGAALRRDLEEVTGEYDFAEVTDGAPGQVRLTAGALAAWVEAQAGAAGRRAALLEQVGAL